VEKRTMPQNNPSRRSLLGGSLAALLSWLGRPPQSTQAALPPPLPVPCVPDGRVNTLVYGTYIGGSQSEDPSGSSE
jgi:hypothetical protein